MALTPTEMVVQGVIEAGFTNYEDWVAAMTRLRLQIDLSKIDSAIARERAAQGADNLDHEAALQAKQAERAAKQAEIDALEQ